MDINERNFVCNSLSDVGSGELSKVNIRYHANVLDNITENGN